MKNIAIVIMMMFVGLTAQSQESKSKNAKHTTEVNGNCEDCQKRIQKQRIRFQE